MKKNIEINEPILTDLTKQGNAIRKIFENMKIFSLNIMASPGAGKTSIILETVKRLQGIYNISVIEGDIVPIDVKKIELLGIPVVLAHTGGSCHLDSTMMKKALRKLTLLQDDLLIVENVGNLICPASFYLGTAKNVVIASVPEGDDKPYKYPTMFRGADIVLLNKNDYLANEDFNKEYFLKGIRMLNPNIRIISMSCKTLDGVEDWVKWIVAEKKNYDTLYE